MIKNKEPLNKDGLGLKKILLLKTKIKTVLKIIMEMNMALRKWIKKGKVNLYLIFKG